MQSTRPELSVMARACAISSCIVKGMSLFLFAGPTQISVEPLCSNSLVPSCVSSALETRDKTTFVGNLSSIAASTRVDEDACVLWSDDGIDYGGEVVNVGESFDAENDIVKCTLFVVGGVFGRSNN